MTQFVVAQYTLPVVLFCLAPAIVYFEVEKRKVVSFLSLSHRQSAGHNRHGTQTTRKIGPGPELDWGLACQTVGILQHHVVLRSRSSSSMCSHLVDTASPAACDVQRYRLIHTHTQGLLLCVCV